MLHAVGKGKMLTAIGGSRFMRSSKKAHRRKAFFHAETVINARNKTISVVMTFMLVFTMLPISAFTYNGEALAESYSSFEESNSSTENSANTEIAGGHLQLN